MEIVQNRLFQKNCGSIRQAHKALKNQCPPLFPRTLTSQTELQHTLENHDLQVKELRGETSTLTRQLDTVHQKSTTQLLQAKNNWENENARLHSKITRAKSLLKARAVSIRDLEDHVQEKNQQLSLNKKAISLLQKEKKKLKFNLKELIVDQSVQVNKIQRRKDNIALAKQQEEKDKIIKLDALEALVGRALSLMRHENK